MCAIISIGNLAIYMYTRG